MNFDLNSSKTIQNLQNSGIPQDFELAGFRILHKLLLSFLEILKFLGTQFSVVHGGGGGGVDSFWNTVKILVYSKNPLLRTSHLRTNGLEIDKTKQAPFK